MHYYLLQKVAEKFPLENYSYMFKPACLFCKNRYSSTIEYISLLDVLLTN